MIVVALIRLENADLELFEAYESAVLPLLAEHDGSLDRRLRSLDRSLETHILTFPSAAAFDAFLSDPRRRGLQDMWTRCGATAQAVPSIDLPTDQPGA